MKRASLAKGLIALIFMGLTVSACGGEAERSAAAVEDSAQSSSDPFNDANAGGISTP